MPAVKQRLVLIVSLALALALAISLASCGGSDETSQEELDRAREEGAQQARQAERVRALEEDLERLEGGGTAGAGGSGTTGGSAAGGTPTGSGLKPCGGDVSAGPNTSCPFALNVASTYRSTGSGVIDVYSPTTDRTYTMTCTSGSPHVCTGGNNASVHFP